jgi:hypothetical protein
MWLVNKAAAASCFRSGRAFKRAMRRSRMPRANHQGNHGIHIRGDAPVPDAAGGARGKQSVPREADLRSPRPVRAAPPFLVSRRAG